MISDSKEKVNRMGKNCFWKEPIILPVKLDVLE